MFFRSSVLTFLLMAFTLAPIAQAAYPDKPVKLLVSGPKSHVKSMAEPLALKGSADHITYGSPGVGGQQHMAGALLAR